MSLLCYTTDSKAVVLVVVVRGVDIRTIQVQVVRVVSIVRRTRPVVAVAALIVGTAAVPVAGQDERILVLDELDTGELGNTYRYSPARQSNKYRKEIAIFANRLTPKNKGACKLVGLWAYGFWTCDFFARGLLIGGLSLPPSDCFVPGRLSFIG